MTVDPRQEDATPSLAIPIRTMTWKRVEPNSLSQSSKSPDSSLSSSSSSLRHDLFVLLSASLVFVALLSSVHLYNLSSPPSLATRPMVRGATIMAPEARTSIKTTKSPYQVNGPVGIQTDGAAAQRKMLADDTPAAVSTPQSRAKAKNQYSPFRSAEEKIKKFQEWENEYLKLLETHGDPRSALEVFIGPAVKHLGVHAWPTYATDKCVAMLEGRAEPIMIFILKHLFHMLGPGWGLVIFHTSDVEDFFIDNLQIYPGAPGQYIEMQRVEPIVFQQANSLPTSADFYQRIGCETILIVQSDTLMLRSEFWPSPDNDGPSLSSLISQYAYLGAPWEWCHDSWCQLGGNGGLSLRKKSVMLDLVREVRCSNWECHWLPMFEHYSHQQEVKMKHVEDTFFAYQLYDHRYKFEQGRTQLATPLENGWFSIESKDFTEVTCPWFTHKVWSYAKPTRYGPWLARTMQYYPELWMTEEELEVLKKEMEV